MHRDYEGAGAVGRGRSTVRCDDEVQGLDAKTLFNESPT